MTKKDRNLVKIVGSGGKGGGREPFEADDNMFARQHAAFIDAIAEGPIKGLVYGDASILVDETRIRDINQRTGQRSNNPNMKNFRIVEAKGLAAQTPNADFFHSFPSASVIEEVGSSELLLNEPQYHTISSGSYEKQSTDYIKVTMSTSGMVKIVKKGDTAGDRLQTSVMFDIDFRWTDNAGVLRTSKKFATGFIGKVSGKYAHTFGFNIEEHKAVNGMVDWAVKVTRVGGDTDNDNHTISNAIYIDTIESSIADKLEYPYTAYIAGAIDAEAFSSIPARGYEIDGKLINIPSNHYPIDYNGRKVTLSSIANFAVGDSVKQDAISISGITAVFANTDTRVDEDGDPDPNADDGYLATATCAAAHGITIGNVFTITIDGASAEADFWEGTFNVEATTATQFTYYLNTPATSTADPTVKTLSSTTAAGTFTGEIFTGGMIDKIDSTNKYLYLRNVSPTANILLGGNITNAGSGASSVQAVEQVLIPANYRRDSANEKVSTMEHDWDGTFYNTWCNNPAWVYNDLFTNKIYGLGNYLSQTQVNKWELYQIGRYCDELVPAGVAAADLLSLYTTDDTNYTGTTGEHEPRFSANLVIGGQQEAFKVLNDVTSIFRGMTYWLNGEAYIVQDSEKDPVYQFTNGNVVDGTFSYEGTANKTRTNQIIVNWNNPQDYYRPRAEIVELEETLQKDGEFLKTESIQAFGCTSRGQARRLGKWKLLSNNLHTNTISFATGLNAAFLRPGDIIQVADNHKSGKSWGGRIKSSSSTSSIKLDRQWEKESGYNYNDYQVTLTFVGYKAMLAQDTATIEVQGSNVTYLRGQEITNWRDSDGIIDSTTADSYAYGWEDGDGDITIDSEEKAANVFDKDGNMVFIQWTPFTQTETKFIDNSDNADPSNLTISTAGLNSAIFSEAPATDSMWIISRSALSTGKTKEEARLYRILQISETGEHQLEVQALEYNATKFDNVDKNEALSEERQVFLPSSFKTTPPPTNLGYGTSLVKLSDNDSLVQRITFSWDPPRNIDDNALYTFVREYEVYYSTDGVKWWHAGNTTNTSIDLDGKQSGVYYLKVFTKSVQEKRSAPANAKLDINFQRAVGPSEGTVGNGDFTINKIGTISGNYSETGGKVTFSPANQQHDDAKNTHTVTGQPQLDFTGLDHTSTTGGDTGYIYMDHGTNRFLAIAHDETSDQFYTVGGDVFAAATGTITCSTSMISTATANPNTIQGLDSTNFDGELALNNVLKFTKSSVNYYHRVRTLTSDSEMLVDPAVRVTVVNADNQAFSKPNFLTDYTNDTIIGMVQKTGSSTYVLTKYGSTSGEGAYEIFGTNEAHTFAANTSNEISATDYSAYTNSYSVRRDGTDWTYAASGTGAATFGLTVTAVTGFSATSDVNIAGDGAITIDDNSLDSVTSGTATIQIKDLQRDYVISNRVLSFSKAVSGSASAGTDAIAIKLTPNKHVVAYDKDGNESTTITFTTAVQGYSGTAYYEFLVDDAAPAGGAVISTTSTWTLPDANEPAESATKTVTVKLRDGGVTGAVKATDTVGLYGVKSGTDAYTVVVTNEAHTLSTTAAGVVTYTGSGTDIRVLKGSSLLEPIASGTPSTGEFKVTVVSDTNITVDPSPTLVDTNSSGTNDTRRFDVADAMTAVNAEIEYSIDIESIQTVVKNQTFAKSNQGQTGDDAKVVVVTASNQVMFRGSEPDVGQTFVWYNPASITISAKTSNTTVNGAWSNSGGAITVVSSAHANPSCTVSSAQIADGMTVTYTLHGDDGGTSDSVTLELIDEADSGITAVLSNETHTYQASSSGAVTDVTGSGTTITLYEGGTKLDYDGTGTADGHWKVNSISNESNLTEGTASSGPGSTGRHAVIGTHTPSTGTDSYTITYNMTGKTSKGKSIDVSKIQTLTKAKAGEDGDEGASVNIVFARAATVPNTPTSSAGIPSADIQWYDTPPSGTNLLWASRGSKAVGATNFVWTTPFQVEGAAHAEVYIYRKNSNAGNSGGSYNFTNNTLTVPTNWVKDPPALTADQDKVYVSVGLATGASTATAASVAWGTPAVYAERQDGATGAASKVIDIYKLSNSNSAASTYPDTTGTITFATGAIVWASSAAESNDWYATAQATTDSLRYLHRRQVTITDASSTTSISSGSWNWSAGAVVSVHGTTGPGGTNNKTVYYLKTSTPFVAPTAPSGNITATSGNNTWRTDFPGVPSATQALWQSLGTDASGSWAWGNPFLWFDSTRFEDYFEQNHSWDFSLSGLNLFNISDGDYNNPTFNESWITSVGGYGASNPSGFTGDQDLPTHTSSTSDPSGSAVVGSTHLKTGVSPEELWIYTTGSGWTHQQINTNDNTQLSAANVRGMFSGSFASGDGAFAFNSSTGEFTMTGPSAAEARAHFSHSGAGSYNATTGVFTGVDSTYSAGDFDITQLDGFTADAYANAELEWGDISVTVGGQYTSWSWLGSLYNPSTTTATVTMAITHPSFGTSVITGTWERTNKTISDFTLSGSPEGTGAGASQNNTWAFGDASGESDNAFGSTLGDHVTKSIYVRHESGKVIALTSNVINANFSVKCLTPAMLPENLQIGDEVDSPQGKTKVTDIIRKQREGYYILEDELEITNDHPILIDGEWILAEEYQGKKEYIDEPTDVIYVETENELLTVKDWTVGGKY